MGGFLSVVAGASLVREGQHGDENCVERRSDGIWGKITGREDVAKSVVVREVRLKRKEKMRRSIKGR
jgi:hypothetical protein